MKPADAITCHSCGAHARVWTTGAKHVEGWPVLVTWTTPEGERTMVEETREGARPPKCRACGEADQRAVVVHERGADGAFAVPAAPSAPLVRQPPPGFEVVDDEQHARPSPGSPCERCGAVLEGSVHVCAPRATTPTAPPTRPPPRTGQLGLFGI
jgi:hypothetical protein